MKKIFLLVTIFVMLAVGSVFLIGCSTEEKNTLINNTNQVVKESKKVLAKEDLHLQNLDVAGLATIQNVDINVEREITPDNTKVKLNTENMQIKINERVVPIVSSILDIIGMKGTLTVAHLEEALSKISISLNADITNTDINGKFVVNNLKNMFSPNKTMPLEMEFNRAVDTQNQWVNDSINMLRSHLINEFAPVNTDNIKHGKKYEFAYANENLSNILNGVLKLFGNDKLTNNNSNINNILNDSFGTNNAKDLMTKYISFSEMKGSTEFNKKNNIEYVETMKIDSKISLNLTSEDMNSLINTLSISLENDKIKQIYSLLNSIADYDKIATGEVSMNFNYEIE